LKKRVIDFNERKNNARETTARFFRRWKSEITTRKRNSFDVISSNACLLSTCTTTVLRTISGRATATVIAAVRRTGSITGTNNTYCNAHIYHIGGFDNRFLLRTATAWRRVGRARGPGSFRAFSATGGDSRDPRASFRGRGEGVVSC